MSLSQSEIEQLAVNAGLSADRAQVAAAVAMAESGGNPNAHNSKPPDDSYGLWQINMIGSLGPSRRKAYGLSADSDLYNPQTNAKVMAKVSSSGGNFSAWSTYTDGAYVKYMTGQPSATSASNANFLTSLIPGYGDAKAVAQGAEALVKAGAWVSNSENWIRIGYVIGGSIVVFGGLFMVIQSTSAGRSATKVAGTVAKGVAIA